MSHEVYPHGNVLVVAERVQNEQVVDPEIKHFLDMKNGAVAGSVVGAAYGVATLVFAIGEATLRHPFEASMLLVYAALGGVLFGAIIGCTGIFARSSPR